MDLTRAAEQFVLGQGTAQTYWLAYSGGLDSHVLLHVFASLRARYPIRLNAVYIDHGMSLHAASWAAHCAEQCRLLDVHFTPHALAKQDVLISPEDTLRQLRYQVFSHLLQSGDCLLTAHHQDDQAETVLLQLLRGAGPKGLAAMPRMKAFSKGFHGRPLLDFTRERLTQYAKQHQLNWIEDESNQDRRYTRNFLRHEVMPLLTKRWPSASQTLARSAEHCANMQVLVESMAKTDLADLHGVQPGSLSVKKILALDGQRQIHVIRSWLAEKQLSMPSSVKMQQILTSVLNAKCDKTPHLIWQNTELRRYRDDLFAMPCLQQHDANQVLQWDICQPLEVATLGFLTSTATIGQGLSADIRQVSVRFRQGGETLQLPDRSHHHDLKKLFQAWGVPPWLRDRIPLIYIKEKLAAVVGFAYSADFLAEKGCPGFLLTWESFR